MTADPLDPFEIPPTLDRQGESTKKNVVVLETSREIVMPGKLSAEVEAELHEIAKNIRERVRRTTLHIVKIGADLITVKEKIGHGAFIKWIDREFGMTDRTARNYIRAAEWAEGKTEIISDLPPTTLYRLAAPSTPDKIKQKVVADIEAGKPIKPSVIDEEIREERRLQKHANWVGGRRRQRRDVTPATLKRREREQAKAVAEAERLDVERKAATEEAVTILRKLPAKDLARLRELLNIPSVLYYATARTISEAEQ